MDHHPQAMTGAEAPPLPVTLPEYLARSSASLPGAIALVHKSNGGWVAWTWREWHAEVARIGAALTARGFRPEDVVAIAAGPSPQALAVTLAAQALGGAALWLDVEAARPSSTISGSPVAIRFGFAADEAALASLRSRLGLADAWTLGLHTADHGSPDDPDRAIRPYAAVVAATAPPDEPLAWARSSDIAFRFAPLGVTGGSPAAPSVASHASLIDSARAWLHARGPVDRLAFTAEAPTSADVAIFFAAWLVGGFPLGLPEDATTANADRRELRPGVVAATGIAYGRLAQQVADELPPPGTLLRRALDVAFASPSRWGQWTVRRPLREVIGFRYARVALVLGPPPPDAAQALFATLGVPLHRLSTAGGGPAQAVAPADDVSLPGLGSTNGPALGLSAASLGELA